jgi:ubiquinone/menaquinone biosynthesis C-methylase UbiE
MSANQVLWEKGDFTRIAQSMRESGERLVARFGVTKNMRVLDLGCGDGTTAIPAAKLGANVLGVDIARNLVQAAKVRARQEGLSNVTFKVGDASDLYDLSDGSFDLVVTMFGAMFAPRPLDVAKEMVRVTRKGGKIIMGNWIPGDPTFVAQVLRISSSYTPPPPEGFVSPMLWGVEAEVTKRFEAAGVRAKNISFERDVYTFNFAGSPSALLNVFRHYYGPTMNAFEAAELAGKASSLEGELEDLFWAQNTNGKPDYTTIPATFLKVTVTV